MIPRSGTHDFWVSRSCYFDLSCIRTKQLNMKCLSWMRITMTYGLTWIFGMIPVLLSDVLAIGLSVDQSAIDDRALSRHVVGIRIWQELGEPGYVLRRLRPVECNALDILPRT